MYCCPDLIGATSDDYPGMPRPPKISWRSMLREIYNVRLDQNLAQSNSSTLRVANDPKSLTSVYP